MAYRYQGDTNQGLIEALEEDDLLKTRKIKNAMLLIQRGDFVPEKYKSQAYMDKPLRIEELGFNISAPHMYVFCLEHLNLHPGNSFLDVGSGCGHMTAIAGHLVGETGYVVGIDVLPGTIEMSNKSLEILKEKGINLSSVSFEKRNVFIPDISCRKWDRIHCGAACPQKIKHKLYELLNPGGILITPLGSSLVLVQKDMNGFTKETKLLDVRYGDLIIPSKEEIEEAEKQRVIIPEVSLSNDYVKMYNNNFLSDVLFLVDNKPIFAHRIILASRCEYFASLYNSGMKDALVSEVVINDYSYEAFAEFIRYIYTGNCIITGTELASELMYVGDYYKMDQLKALSEIFLSKSLTIDNVCSILEMSYHFCAEQLKRIAFDFITKNFESVSHSKGFGEMGNECMREILTVALRRLSGV